MSEKYKMLGVVVVYKPDTDVVENIKGYVPYIDKLIIWDNSPLELNLHNVIMERLHPMENKILWHGTGKNLFIAPAINFAWNYAKKIGMIIF